MRNFYRQIKQLKKDKLNLEKYYKNHPHRHICYSIPWLRIDEKMIQATHLFQKFFEDLKV